MNLFAIKKNKEEKENNMSERVGFPSPSLIGCSSLAVFVRTHRQSQPGHNTFTQLALDSRYLGRKSGLKLCSVNSALVTWMCVAQTNIVLPLTSSGRGTHKQGFRAQISSVTC